GCQVYNNIKLLQTTLVLVNEYDKRNIFMTTAIMALKPESCCTVMIGEQSAARRSLIAETFI
ncbi:MAG: hypothetical protein PVG35_23605, partial [Desulfobacterales bacterium]